MSLARRLRASAPIYGAWLLVIGACIPLAAYALSFPLNHDVGWYLYLAGELFEGAELYTDFIEVNPPLVVHLLMIPTGLAEVTGTSAVTWTTGLIFVAAILSIFGTGAVVSTGSGDSYQGPVVSLALAAAFLGLAGSDFGQREHLGLILFVPYVALSAREGMARVPMALVILIGIAAGVGFSLKPHFLLVWGGLEMAILMARGGRLGRWVRPELLAAGACIAVAGLVVLLRYPEYPRLLWEHASLYTAFAAYDRAEFLTRPETVVLAIIAVAFMIVRPSLGREARRLAGAFLLLGLLTWLVAVVQGKGWYYHLLPTTTALIVCFFTVAGAAIRGRELAGHRMPRRVLAFSGTIIVMLAIPFVRSVLNNHADSRTQVERTVAAQSEVLAHWGARSMVSLAASVGSGFPTVNYTGVEWTSPYPSLWWVQAVHGQQASARIPGVRSAAERRLRNALIERLLDSRPDVVFVARRESGIYAAGTFPYVEYLSTNHEFQRFWQNYEYRGLVGNYAVYTPDRLRAGAPGS